MTALTIRVRIDGARETLAAFRSMPKDASTALRKRSLELSQSLAEIARAAGEADTPQSAAVAKTVKAVRDRTPVVQAGGRKKVTATATASDLLYGSEFGSGRRSGWYGRRQYAASPARQFRPHRGAASYWFLDTVTNSSEVIGRAWQRAADDIMRAFESGGPSG